MAKEVKKVGYKIWCCWCHHNDYYLIGKGDQPTCKKCNRFLTKEYRIMTVYNKFKNLQGR